MTDAELGLCAVCGQEPALGVAAMPGIPMSVSYGADCLRANAHPYGLVVSNTAVNGGLEYCAEWWRDIVNDTLTHLRIEPDRFLADVAAAMRAELEWEGEGGRSPAPDRRGVSTVRIVDGELL